MGGSTRRTRDAKLLDAGQTQNHNKNPKPVDLVAPNDPKLPPLSELSIKKPQLVEFDSQGPKNQGTPSGAANRSSRAKEPSISNGDGDIFGASGVDDLGSPDSNEDSAYALFNKYVKTSQDEEESKRREREAEENHIHNTNAPNHHVPSDDRPKQQAASGKRQLEELEDTQKGRLQKEDAKSTADHLPHEHGNLTAKSVQQQPFVTPSTSSHHRDRALVDAEEGQGVPTHEPDPYHDPSKLETTKANDGVGSQPSKAIQVPDDTPETSRSTIVLNNQEPQNASHSRRGQIPLHSTFGGDEREGATKHQKTESYGRGKKDDSNPSQVQDLGTGSQLSRRVNEQGSPFSVDTKLPMHRTDDRVRGFEPKHWETPQTPRIEKWPDIIHDVRATYLRRPSTAKPDIVPGKPWNNEDPTLVEGLGEATGRLDARDLFGSTGKDDDAKVREPQKFHHIPSRYRLNSKVVKPNRPAAPPSSSSSTPSKQGERAGLSHEDESMKNPPRMPEPPPMPHEQELLSALTSVSRKLLSHLSSRDEAINAIVRSYAVVGKRLLHSLAHEHQKQELINRQKVQDLKREAIIRAATLLKNLTSDLDTAQRSQQKLAGCVGKRETSGGKSIAAVNDMLKSFCGRS